jgi:hypothetical protein
MSIETFIFINYKKILWSMYQNMIDRSVCGKVNGIDCFLNECWW